MKRAQFVYWLFALTALGGLFGCGGGSSGSGLKTYEGNVATKDGGALEGVNITIELTGDSSLTDSRGAFAIKSDAFGPEVPILLESSNFKHRFVLNNVPSDSARITLALTVSSESNSLVVSHTRVHARFSGLCDRYFENREVLRQANKVPEGTMCSLNVEVLGDGKRLANVPVALQYSACQPSSPWITLTTEPTGEGRYAGSAEVNFEFIDSSKYCRYRVVAPFGYNPFGVYPIETFSEQEYHGK